MAADPTRSHGPPGTRSRPDADTTVPLVGPAGGLLLPAGERFVLGEPIARGGMGEVYAARDTRLNRDVAVKALQPKLAGTAAERRFWHEAAVTGQLQHPAIPPVYDLGTLADGRPFLAMKLIRGQTLDALLKADGPGGRWLGVFEGVCQAVAYAHAHNVIHRDLKPANVMVGAFGEVQVMDWGLAKLLGTGGPAGDDPDATAPGTVIESGRDATDATRAGSVLGSPPFMAPEQAIGAIDQLDRRTDVFGLGAVLCALLTGQPPYTGADAESTRQLAARGKLDDAFVRLDGCGAEPDLIALCKRCLAVEPATRPADAGAVAATVAALRQAADERARRAEVEAGQATVRAAEQAKRRRAVQWAAGVVAGVLLLGLAGTAAGLWRADRARRAAEAAERAESERRAEAEEARSAESRQRAAAEAKEREAEAVVQFFTATVLAVARPKGQQGGFGPAATVRQAIDFSLAVLDKRFKDQPLVEARLRLEIGQTLQMLGEKQKALAQCERARTLFTERLGPNDPLTLWALNVLATSHKDMGRYAEAIPLYDHILAAATTTDRSDSELRAAARLNLGNCYMGLERYTDALREYELAVSEYRQLYSDDHPAALDARNNAALARAALGELWEAVRLLQQVLDVQRRARAADHPGIVKSIYALAICHARLNRLDESLRLREESLSLSRQSLGPAHPDTLGYQAELLNRYIDLGRYADAVQVAEAGAAACLKALGPTDPATLNIRNALAVQYSRAGRPADAIRTHEENLAARKLVSGPDHLDTLRDQGNLARAYSRAERHADALRLHEETLAALNRTVGPANTNTVTANRQYAESLLAAGRGTDAMRVVDDTLPRAAALPDGGRKVLHLLMAVRSQHFQQSDDPAGCRATAERWEGLKLTDEYGPYNAACWRAVAAGQYAKANQPADATADADRAMAWLSKAVAAGYRDRAHMQKDPDLDPLRGRADFRTLLASIPERAPQPRPAK